jgi:hypothetical protein
MRFRGFFDDVPRIKVVDPLADPLGAAEGGVLEYRDPGAVKPTGLSGPQG